MTQNKQESHEDFMKRTCGEDFWDLPEDERFLLVLRKCLRVPDQVSDKEFERRARDVAESMSDFK